MRHVWEDYKAYPCVVDFAPKLSDSHLPALPISLLGNHSMPVHRGLCYWEKFCHLS
jgi:hypothetical protein